MSDNRQTTRTFQCREALWACFEQMARELECSVDYLLNDAMKQYALQRGYNSMGLDSYGPGASSSSMPPSLRPSGPGRAPAPPVSVSGMPTNQLPPPGRPPAYYGGQPQQHRPSAPLPPPSQPARRPPPAPLPPPPAARAPQVMPSAQPGYYAPPAPQTQGFAGGMERPPVNIYYMGERDGRARSG
jgi:hypothetical protein